ncbi:MAG: hypothetical protein P1V97_10325 [Planctomycetota bacterium]|nr:hypothetical protein [Planctomycetota bacterium]
MKPKILCLFVLFSTLSGWSSVAPDEPDAAKGSVIELEKNDLKENGPVHQALTGLSLINDENNEQRFTFKVFSASGEAASRLGQRDFDFDITSDDLDRLVWDLNGQNLHIRKDPKLGAVLEEIVVWAGETPFRFVTKTTLFPKDGLKSGVTTVKKEGFFLAYRGDQVETINFKGELSLNFELSGFQELELPSGKKTRAIRVAFEIELDFEEAQELVPDNPKVSNLSLSALLWFEKGQPILITQRITGSRGPVRIKVLQTVAELKKSSAGF